MPRTPAAIAPPPNRFWPREKDQIPAAIARMPSAAGAAFERVTTGGSASQKPSAPRTIP
jgi:hypothetical protein